MLRSFIEAELLRHVADLRLDTFSLFNNIVSRTGATALIGPERPQSIRMKVVLPLPVRSEKSIDLALFYLQIDLVDGPVRSRTV